MSSFAAEADGPGTGSSRHKKLVRFGLGFRECFSCYLLLLVLLAYSTGFVSFEVVCKSYCTQLDHCLAMRTYHSSIFPYVGFSLGQVFSSIISFGYTILSFDVTYWFFDALRLLHGNF